MIKILLAWQDFPTSTRSPKILTYIEAIKMGAEYQADGPGTARYWYTLVWSRWVLDIETTNGHHPDESINKPFHLVRGLLRTL